jgi:ABC-type polysaccharide/polyol phosphate transport system ATPase subunit
VVILDKGEIIMDGKPQEVTDIYDRLIKAKDDREAVREEIKTAFLASF